MSLQAVTTALSVLEVLARSPGIEKETVANYLSLANGLIGLGTAAEGELQDLTREIERMAAEGRNPTQQEWDALFGRIQSTSRRIQSWRPGKL